MKLYFQAGTRKRLAINTDRKTWNNNYFYLGGHRKYIKISAADMADILREIDFCGYDYQKEFE